jgi:hypothetical protein
MAEHSPHVSLVGDALFVVFVLIGTGLIVIEMATNVSNDLKHRDQALQAAIATPTPVRTVVTGSTAPGPTATPHARQLP